jgi:hypothetical protein
VARKVAQSVVGARDLCAYAALCDLMYTRLRLDCRVRVCLHPARTSLRAARQYLNDLRADRNLTAIVVVGSPVVNPMAAPLAEAFLEGTGQSRLPARFAWAFDRAGTGSSRPFHKVLSEPRRVPDGEEGIWLSGRRILGRVNDDAVRESLRRSRPGPFKDCGMLLLRYDCTPMLILCAGHGGCGTWAATLALGEIPDLAVRHQESIDPSVSQFSRDRIFALVDVDRHKPSTGGRSTPSRVDDLVFDPEYGSGWKFLLDGIER